MDPNAHRKRSRSSDTRESRLPLAARASGIARLSRTNSNLSCSRLSRQSSRSSTKSCLGTPLRGNDGGLKLETPRSRLEVKSPQRLKALYTNVDDKLNVKRVMALVQNEGLPFEVSKPVDLNAFVGITQMLFSKLSNKAKLTMKNYKTEIPAILKVLKYPITINQSFMKTPNTPTNFQHVMSMWAFLLDIIEVISEPWNGIGMIPSMGIDYIIKAKENEAIARAEVIDAMYASFGMTEAEVTEKMANVDERIAVAKELLVKRDNEIAAMEAAIQKKCDEITELTQQKKNFIEQQAEHEKSIKKTNQAIEYLQNCLVQAEKDELDKEKHLQLINEKILANGHCIQEIEELDRQIKFHTMRAELSRKRNEELSDQRRAQQDKQAELEKCALELIYEFNKKIMMSSLSEQHQRELLLNEKEFSAFQIQKAIGVMRQLKQQAERSGADYREMVDKATELSVEWERKLSEATRAAEDARKKGTETAKRLIEAEAEAAEVHKLGDMEVEKITRLLKLKQRVELEYNNAEPCVQNHYEETERRMEYMKSSTEEIARGVSELRKFAVEKRKEREDYLMELVNKMRGLMEEEQQ